VVLNSLKKKINLRLILIALISALLVPYINNSSAKAVASCSPTETIDGLYTVQTFSTTGTCQWSVPTGITSLDSLVVAGGGGGGSGTITDSTPANGGGGGGGGGGQVIETTSRIVSSSQVITIVVGSGGSGGGEVGVSSSGRTAIGNYGYPGNSSSISLASGWSTTAVAGGGSLMDASKYNLLAGAPGRDRNNNIGGDITVGGFGGGSGSGNVGANPSSRRAGQGASDNSGATPSVSTSILLGVSSSINGSAVVYANGGGGGDETSAGSTATTYGSGGGGGRSAIANGGNNGLSGVVIIRYLTYVAPAPSSSDNNSVTLKSTTIDPCAGVQKVVIYFDGGKFNLDKADKTKINNLVTLMNSCSFTRINLSGYTSIDQPDSANYALFRKNLSLKRAKAVEEAMFNKLSKKNKKIKVKTKALSNAKPIKANNSEKNRSSNRRVEITVY
jgi:outer membrane protein OmpA-like peptidoglycan-associated protein